MSTKEEPKGGCFWGASGAPCDVVEGLRAWTQTLGARPALDRGLLSRRSSPKRRLRNSEHRGAWPHPRCPDPQSLVPRWGQRPHLREGCTRRSCAVQPGAQREEEAASPCSRTRRRRTSRPEARPGDPWVLLLPSVYGHGRGGEGEGGPAPSLQEAVSVLRNAPSPAGAPPPAAAVTSLKRPL